MLIAREKRKENIAEYILYMWQLEDMLRALGMDMENVNKFIVSRFEADEATSREIYDWYDNLLEMMRKEKVEKKGHLQIIKNNINELTELHFYLLHQANDFKYKQIVTTAAAGLAEFRQRSELPGDATDVELALTALYGHLMLKLQQKEVTDSTRQAMESFSKMIGYLAAKYKQMEEEHL